MNDLERMSRVELMKLRRDVEKAIATVSDRERKKAREAAERAAAEHGFSLADLTSSSSVPKRAKPRSPAKYQNPANPVQTWSGRGRKPGWIIEAIASGKKITEFEL